MSEDYKLVPASIDQDLDHILREWAKEALRGYKDSLKQDVFVDVGLRRVVFSWFKKEKK